MAIEALIPEGYDPDKQGFDEVDPGNYHMVVVDIDEEGFRLGGAQNKNGNMIVEFEVVAGSTPNQEGKTHREWFDKGIKSMGRIHQLAMALGFITPDELKKLQASGSPVSYELERDGKGKQLCMALKPDEYQGKVRMKAGFAMYNLRATNVADPKKWPKNEMFLKKLGLSSAWLETNAKSSRAGRTGDVAAGGTGAGTTTQAQGATAPAAGAAADDGLGDIF